MLPVTPQACGSGRPASNGRLRSGAPVLCLLSYVRVEEPPAGVEPAPRPYKGRVLAVDTTEARWRRWESNPRLLRCKRSGLPQASPGTSILVGIEGVVTRHRHPERRQRVQDADRTRMVAEDVRQPLVDAGCLVGAGSSQFDAARRKVAARCVPIDQSAGADAALDLHGLPAAVGPLFNGLLP